MVRLSPFRLAVASARTLQWVEGTVGAAPFCEGIFRVSRIKFAMTTKDYTMPLARFSCVTITCIAYN
ncbi:hypothetical protein Poly41_16810 [Novipirellula artificiosorum]|uniref:Uncharacterized protein n=1 Tax=Novipirellula artificiosorum TaxID=2528016 RepID=A0A5C6E0H7_9BACT|nr:hypothetical protein Poly41_16810 [Novipirellula artificiosorum]